MKIEGLKKKFPPKLSGRKRVFLYMITVVVVIFCMLEVLWPFLPQIIEYAVYTVTGCMFMLSGYYLVFDIRYFICCILKPLIEGNSITSRYTKDYRFRAIITTGSSFGINFFYAFLNGFYGMWYHSVWFGSLSAYYIVLSVMRFLIINYERKPQGEKEYQMEQIIYKRCGLLLALVTLALGAAVMIMIDNDIEKKYPGMLIYAIAVYTFYRITISSVNMVKVKKFKSPLLTAIRYIGYAEALVSVLSLQMAMFTSFNEGDRRMTRIFNSVTGTVVCVIILLMSITMMRAKDGRKKKINQ